MSKKKVETIVDIRDFWEDNFIVTTKEGWPICGLCGNTGIIDTTKSAVSPKGEKVGKKFHCLCPNGRAMKANDRTSNID